MVSDQATETKDPWKIFRYFLGEWKGEGEGKVGVSQVERRYNFILNDHFIQVNNRSVYEPQENNPQGEIHEDMGLFSYDKSRGMHILREFHVEGYINQYSIKIQDEEGHILEMTTEAIENIPPGWRARTIYQILNEDEFDETFELAKPGQDWTCFMTNHLRRERTG